MDYTNANPDVSFAHAAEYIYWRIKTSSDSRGKVCDRMHRLSQGLPPMSKKLGIAIGCYVRYNLDVDPVAIDKALKKIKSLRTRGAISIMLDTGLSTERTIYAKFKDYDEERGVLYGRYQLSERSVDIIRKIKEASVEELTSEHLILNANVKRKGKVRLVRSTVHTHYLTRWIRRLEIVSGINFHRLLAHKKSMSIYPYNALVRYCRFPISTTKMKRNESKNRKR